MRGAMLSLSQEQLNREAEPDYLIWLLDGAQRAEGQTSKSGRSTQMLKMEWHAHR